MLSRGHDQQAAEARHRLANPPPPPTRHVRHLWQAFLALCTTRQVNGMALCPISRMEIAQWQRDEMIELEPWERKAILRLDQEFVAANSATGAGKTAPGGEPEAPIEES
jgi:hypothetical protein